MRKLTFLLLFATFSFNGCNKRSPDLKPSFGGQIRMVTPFTQPSMQSGQLYLSNGRLRVDLGSMVVVYVVSQKKGWQMFPQLRQYVDIGDKQASTYLPQLTNGSPCPNSEHPSECKEVARENIGGRSATKWKLMNQHGESVYLWTDDQLGVALRWEIENVTYELLGVHKIEVADNMFELPTGYTKAPEKWQKTFGSYQK